MARLQAKRSINATLGTKGDGVSGLLSAFSSGKKKTASTKVAPEAQVEELRKANFLANKSQGKNADKGFVLSSLFQRKL